MAENVAFSDMFVLARSSNATYLGQDGILRTAGNNEPRLDYTASGTPLGLLIEGAGENLIGFSNRFDTSSWFRSQVIVTASAFVAPDGKFTAQKIDTTSSTFSRVFYPLDNLVDGVSPYCFSAFVHQGNLDFVDLSIELLNGTSQKQSHFIYNFVTKVFTPISDHFHWLDHGVVNYPAGWIRLWASTVNNSTGNTTFFGSLSPNQDGTFTGTANGFHYFWGAQIERTVFPSSIILTDGDVGSRAADDLVLRDLEWLRQDQGVFAFSWDVIGKTSSGAGYSQGLAALVGSGSNDTVQFIATTGDVSSQHAGQLISTISSVVEADLFVTETFSPGNVMNTVFSVQSGAFAIVTDVSVGTAQGSGGLSKPFAGFRLGSVNSTENAPGHLYGHLRSFTYYPTTLTQSKLSLLQSTNGAAASLALPTAPIALDFISDNYRIDYQPTYEIRAGFYQGDWAEVSSSYTWAQLASAFVWEELAAGPVPILDVNAVAYDRQLATMFDSLSAGVSDLELDNRSGKYTPAPSSRNVMRVGQVITMKARTLPNSIYGCFTAYANKFTASAQPGKETVLVEASDLSKVLKRNVNGQLLFDTRIASAFYLATNSIGIGDERRHVIGELTGNIPFSFINNIQVVDAMKQFIEAGNHRSYVDGRGRLVLEDRNSNLMAGSVSSYDAFAQFSYVIDDQYLRNTVKVTTQQRQQGTIVGTLAWVTDIPTIAASASLVFTLEFANPVNNERPTPVSSLVTPVSSQDYQANTSQDGTGSDMTSQISVSVVEYATTALCSVTNPTSESVFLTRFQLRGVPVPAAQNMQATAEVSSSVALYGSYLLDVQNDLVTDADYNARYAEYLARVYKDPVPVPAISIINQFPGAVVNELSQRVSVINSLCS